MSGKLYGDVSARPLIHRVDFSFSSEESANNNAFDLQRIFLGLVAFTYTGWLR